jgi:hypothetical protein
MVNTMMKQTRWSVPNAAVRATAAVALAVTVAGCAAVHTQSERLASGQPAPSSASCGAALARAHTALAAAAGDSAPAAHMAFASHAAAMHEYHICLASGGTP